MPPAERRSLTSALHPQTTASPEGQSWHGDAGPKSPIKCRVGSGRRVIAGCRVGKKIIDSMSFWFPFSKRITDNSCSTTYRSLALEEINWRSSGAAFTLLLWAALSLPPWRGAVSRSFFEEGEGSAPGRCCLPFFILWSGATFLWTLLVPRPCCAWAAVMLALSFKCNQF